MSEPLVTIELKEYQKLKDLEHQFSYLIDKVKIDKRCLQRFPDDPLCEDVMKIRVRGTIKKKDYDFFINNLLGVDDLLIDNSN